MNELDAKLLNDNGSPTTGSNKVLCKFCTKIISKSNISKHYKLCKLRTDIVHDIADYPNKVACTYCSKLIHKTNLSRHYKICKSNDITLLDAIPSDITPSDITPSSDIIRNIPIEIGNDDHTISTTLENEFALIRKDNEKMRSELIKCMNMLTNENHNKQNIYYVV